MEFSWGKILMADTWAMVGGMSSSLRVRFLSVDAAPAPSAGPSVCATTGATLLGAGAGAETLLRAVRIGEVMRDGVLFTRAMRIGSVGFYQG